MMAAMNHHVRCPCPAITSRLARASPRAPRSHRCPPGRCMGYHQGGAMESQSADARRCSTRHSVTCCKPKHRPVCALPPQALARCPCSAVTSRMARVSPSTGCNIPFGAMPTSAVPLIRLSHARDPPTRELLHGVGSTGRRAKEPLGMPGTFGRRGSVRPTTGIAPPRREVCGGHGVTRWIGRHRCREHPRAECPPVQRRQEPLGGAGRWMGGWVARCGGGGGGDFRAFPGRLPARKSAPRAARPPPPAARPGRAEGADGTGGWSSFPTTVSGHP
eukprot:gene21949-biopygen5708